MRLIALAGGVTLGRPRLTDPVHRGIGAAEARAPCEATAALATSLRLRRFFSQALSTLVDLGWRWRAWTRRGGLRSSGSMSPRYPMGP